MDDIYACSRFMNFRMHGIIQDKKDDKYSLYQLYRNNVFLSLSKNGPDSKVFNFLIKEDPWECKNFNVTCAERQILVGPIMYDIGYHIKSIYGEKRNNLPGMDQRNNENSEHLTLMHANLNEEEKTFKERALRVCQDNNCKKLQTIWEEERIQQEALQKEKSKTEGELSRQGVPLKAQESRIQDQMNREKVEIPITGQQKSSWCSIF